jgi:hypothetical protein
MVNRAPEVEVALPFIALVVTASAIFVVGLCPGALLQRNAPQSHGTPRQTRHTKSPYKRRGKDISWLADVIALGLLD